MAPGQSGLAGLWVSPCHVLLPAPSWACLPIREMGVSDRMVCEAVVGLSP